MQVPPLGLLAYRQPITKILLLSLSSSQFFQFIYSMDRYNTNPHYIPESYYSQDRQESLIFPTATSKSYPRRFGHSVQTLDSPHYEYLNHQGTNQDTFDLQHILDDYSILDLPPVENLSILTELITQKDLDDIVPVDDLTCTDSPQTNLQQTTQKSPSEHSPVTLSHSSLHPVTTTIPLVQQQVQTEPVGYQLTEYFNSGESPTGTLSDTYRRWYHLAYRRAYRAEMATSGDQDKAKQAGRAAGKATGRAASKAQRDRTNKPSADNQLAISSREGRIKAYGRTYSKAYQKAYRAEMAISGNQDKAKQVGGASGRAATKARRDRINKPSTDNQFLAISSREARIKTYVRAYNRAYSKAYQKAYRAEMSLSDNINKANQAGQAAGKAASKNKRERIQASTDFNVGQCQPIPNFCDKVRELFTIPIEPISP